MSPRGGGSPRGGEDRAKYLSSGHPAAAAGPDKSKPEPAQKVAEGWTSPGCRPVDNDTMDKAWLGKVRLGSAELRQTGRHNTARILEIEVQMKQLLDERAAIMKRQLMCSQLLARKKNEMEALERKRKHRAKFGSDSDPRAAGGGGRRGEPTGSQRGVCESPALRMGGLMMAGPNSKSCTDLEGLGSSHDEGSDGALAMGAFASDGREEPCSGRPPSSRESSTAVHLPEIWDLVKQMEMAVSRVGGGPEEKEEKTPVKGR